MNILELARRRILVYDGAMGTAIQGLHLDPVVFGAYEGCNEFLVLSAPDAIAGIHRSYLQAGAHVVETDTFGASPLVLAEYGLEQRCEEINETAAAIARREADAFATPKAPRFVAGSVGPGTRLATLGQISWDEMYRGFRRQVRGLLAGGVDIIQIETVQDLLQARAAIAAARDEMRCSRDVPLYVSVTIEQTGTLLTGADMATVITVLEPLGVDILGMNCATGPVAMRPHLETLARLWPGLVGVYPNAGLPVPCATGICYPEQPPEFSHALTRFIADLRINVIGGCCGTTPEHIRALSKAVEHITPTTDIAVSPPPAVASLFAATGLEQQPPPFIIGERANATGSKAFREALLADDHEGCFNLLVEQEEHGSHAADLSVAYPGRSETADMNLLVERAGRECRLPLVIDSTDVDVLEAALQRYPGRAIINSINLEDGGRRADRVCRLARRHGAALICLTIDEEGMAMTAGRKLAVAHRLADLCINTYGMRAEDLLIDPLTFTIGSGDPSLKDAALQTLEALRRIRQELPGVHTLLGLSNISFGLSADSRPVLNSVFLAMALKAGLSAAILNPRHIMPLVDIAGADLTVARNLIENNTGEHRDDPLEAFINHFQGRVFEDSAETIAELPAREAIRQGIVKGRTDQVLRRLPDVLHSDTAEDILNTLLVPAMKEVGDLFGSGKLQLPFVLKSAETMKRAVDALKPHFTTHRDRGAAKTLLLATVRGDVHDIGKNLVNIIVSNNGYNVVDLGTKVPVETIIARAEAAGADVVGMSGLLVSSAMVMAENLRAMTDAGCSLPVLVGGAALNPGFTLDTLEPSYGSGDVYYCADAFAGLEAMQAITAGTAPRKPRPAAPGRAIPADGLPPEAMNIRTVEAPRPPFWGSRIMTDIPLSSVFSLINEVALFRGRWGYRRGSMAADDYRRLMDEEVRPNYEMLQRIVQAERLFEPKIAYGYFHARGDGDSLIIDDPQRPHTLRFPRRSMQPAIAIPDFFRRDDDVAGFFVVTLGSQTEHRGRQLFEQAGYLDYFLLHGLAVEATDALAEFCHEMMRHELGIGEEKRLDWQGLVTQKYRGSRYGFGYPACPDLSANEAVFDLLQTRRIGVDLTENFQMVPEFSTSALVAHHPQAKYFTV